MQVHLNEEEVRQQLEVEAYDKMKEEELEEKKINDKAKRKKADKTFQRVVFGTIALILIIVLVKWLFM